MKVGEKSSNLKSSFNKAQSFHSTAGSVMGDRGHAMRTQVTFSKFAANDAKAREMSVPADQSSLNALPAMGRASSINSQQNAYFDQSTTAAVSRGGKPTLSES